jgi:hypothetical protein
MRLLSKLRVLYLRLRLRWTERARQGLQQQMHIDTLTLAHWSAHASYLKRQIDREAA